MKQHKQKIDRLFHTLESKGYECIWYDWGIMVRTPQKISEIYLNDAGEPRDTFLTHTAKLLAHRHGVRFNAPFEGGKL